MKELADLQKISTFNELCCTGFVLVCVVGLVVTISHIEEHGLNLNIQYVQNVSWEVSDGGKVTGTGRWTFNKLKLFISFVNLSL